MVKCAPAAQFIATAMVHGPAPVTAGLAADAQVPLAEVTNPAPAGLAVCGADQPAGMVTDVRPDSAATAVILKVNWLPVLPAVTDVGVSVALAGAAAAARVRATAADGRWAASAVPAQLAPAAAVTAMT